jgi:hypothetical protein
VAGGLVAHAFERAVGVHLVGEDAHDQSGLEALALPTVTVYAVDEATAEHPARADRRCSSTTPTPRVTASWAIEVLREIEV